MSCGCNNTPCSCSPAPQPVCPPEGKVSKCDLYRPGDANCWVEKGDETAKGICMLDTLEECQIIYILERDDRARADLLKVTSDEALRALATSVPRLPVVERADAEQALVNQPNSAASNPFYAIFRGQPPFAQ